MVLMCVSTVCCTICPPNIANMLSITNYRIWKSLLSDNLQTLENTEGVITNRQSRETRNIGIQDK
jgi:hypothetical protein